MTGMSKIVKNIVRFIAPMMMLLGVYLMLHAETSIGGGFASGILITASFVLLVLAFGRQALAGKMSESSSMLIMVVFALVFLFAPKRGFGVINDEWAMIICNFAIGMFTVGALTAGFLALASFRVKKE